MRLALHAIIAAKERYSLVYSTNVVLLLVEYNLHVCILYFVEIDI